MLKMARKWVRKILVCIRMLRNMVFTLCGDGIPPWVIKVMERLVQTLVEWLLLPMEQKC